MVAGIQSGWWKAARERGYWRSAVSLLAALSFLLLVSASVTHVHKSSATIHDCAVCAVVADKLADTPVPPVLVPAHQPPCFPLPAARASLLIASNVRWLPPGRGPPSASV
ncbi:hypothetical protein [Pseudoduganella danionis]|uniref:hypothetical protein n=1 Tax=Pseudoduganella danionis TaxID=1890295 RepID=UPI0035B09C0E